MKSKYKIKYLRNKLLIKTNKINKNFISEELEKLIVNENNKIVYINENNKIRNNMIDDNFKEEVFGKLDFLEIEQNIENIKM